jgi:hypothetical protein
MELDDRILFMLKDGHTQAQISVELKKRGIWPNSIRTVELRLKKAREIHEASTLFHLACILTKEGYFDQEFDKKED